MGRKCVQEYMLQQFAKQTCQEKTKNPSMENRLKKLLYKTINNTMQVLKRKYFMYALCNAAQILFEKLSSEQYTQNDPTVA